MAFEGKGTVLGGKSGKESPERIGRIRWEKMFGKGRFMMGFVVL